MLNLLQYAPSLPPSLPHTHICQFATPASLPLTKTYED